MISYVITFIVGAVFGVCGLMVTVCVIAGDDEDEF